MLLTSLVFSIYHKASGSNKIFKISICLDNGVGFLPPCKQEITHIGVKIEAFFQDKQELTTCQRMVKEGQMYHGLNYVDKKNSGSYLVQFETVNLIHLALERFNILSNTGMWVMLL